jgi:predicted  nucleic acid-binding Zn-ribbon protein
MMTVRSDRILVSLAWLVVGGLAGSLAAPRVLKAQQPDVLSALLTEVRGLRAAIEQMASAGPRIQLAMGRLQLQEQRVNNLLRRLEDIRAELRNAENQAREAAQQQAAIERALREANPPERQTQLEWELAALKSGMAKFNSDYQRLLGDEAAMAQEIASEQARWSEINQRLEELDRALARPRER